MHYKKKTKTKKIRKSENRKGNLQKKNYMGKQALKYDKPHSNQIREKIKFAYYIGKYEKQ